MVSNEEIRERLRNRREGNVGYGYLVCSACGGYYELQPGESWKDFDTECECGGQLVQSTTKTPFMTYEEYENKKFETEIFLGYLSVFILWPAALILGFYLITRSNERANLHGKIILVVSIIPIFIIAISALIIYRSYFSVP